MRKVTSWMRTAVVVALVSSSAYAADHGANPVQHADHKPAPGEGHSAGHKEGAARPKPAEACPMDDAAKTAAVLRFLHASNQEEIRGGQRAAVKTQVPEIKEFANRIVKDHVDLDRRLMEAAKKQDIDLSEIEPVDPVRAALRIANEINEKMTEKKSGPSFDAAYIGQQLENHELVMQVIVQGTKAATNGEMKSVLEDARKVIAAHMGDAEHLGEKVHFMPGPAVGGGPGPAPAGHDGGATEPPRK